MSALHLVPTAPESELPASGGAPIRRLTAVHQTVSSPPARPRSPAAPATLGPAGPASPNESAGNGRPLKAVGEKGEVCAIVRGTVQAAIEVLAGTRPIHQLARRLDQRCLASLQHRAALTRRLATGSSPTAGRLHRNPAVRSVRACEVAAGIYEASAVVVDELRVRAVAVRLERSNQVWRVTALEIG
jgi:hypothetical protein